VNYNRVKVVKVCHKCLMVFCHLY